MPQSLVDFENVLKLSMGRSFTDVLTTGFLENKESYTFYTTMCSSMFLEFDSGYLHIESSSETGQVSVSLVENIVWTFGDEGEYKFCVSSAVEVRTINHEILGYDLLIQEDSECVMGVGFKLKPNFRAFENEHYIYFDAYNLDGFDLSFDQSVFESYSNDGKHTLRRHR